MGTKGYAIMPVRSDPNFPDDSFEQYSMGRLPANDLEAFEEHLLICPECQDRLTESDRFVRTMREAARRVEGFQKDRRRRPRGRFVALTAAAAIFGTIFLLLQVYLRSGRPGSPTSPGAKIG